MFMVPKPLGMSVCSIQSLGKVRHLQLFEWPNGIRERPADGQLYSNLHGIHHPTGVRQRRAHVRYHQRGFGWDNRTRNLDILVRCRSRLGLGLG